MQNFPFTCPQIPIHENYLDDNPIDFNDQNQHDNPQ